LQKSVQTRLALLVRHANVFYGKRMPVPKLIFDLRGMTAGQLVSQRITRSKSIYTIRINNQLLERSAQAILTEVLPHEVAHMVVDWVFGKRVKPHGVEWRQVMRECFECEPNRCHQLPTEQVRHHPRRHIYQCDCQEHPFTDRRHRSAMKGSHYICQSCRGTLVFKATLVTD